MKFRLPFFGKKENVSTGYDIQGENNKIIIVEEDGTERELRQNEKIEGLNIIVHGNENLIKISSNTCFGTGASFEINTNNCQIRIKEAVSVTNFRINFWGEAHNSTIEIGKNFMTGGMGIACSQGNSSLVIGDDCIASSNIMFWLGDGHTIVQGDKVINDTPVKIELGPHCWIGYNCIFTKNAKCGKDTIIAAGSVVTREFLEGNVVLAGNPAKIVKKSINWLR